MDTNLVKRNEIAQMTMDDIARMSDAFQKSGMFTDIKSAAMAMVKIQAGLELGIKPFAAMTGIFIIQGRPTIGAGIIASRVKASGKYDYTVIEMTDLKCSIDFKEGGKVIGNSIFTIEDAKKAGTGNMSKFPKNMLFARAISNGVKWFAPDVFDGPVYTPEEFETPETKTEDIKHEDVITKDAETTVNNEVETYQDEQPAQIPGAWIAKMEKCKSKKDVLDVYAANKLTVDASPELQKLLKETQNSFTTKTK